MKTYFHGTNTLLWSILVFIWMVAYSLRVLSKFGMCAETYGNQWKMENSKKSDQIFIMMENYL